LKDVTPGDEIIFGNDCTTFIGTEKSATCNGCRDELKAGAYNVTNFTETRKGLF
jgi:hypothetical protein